MADTIIIATVQSKRGKEKRVEALLKGLLAPTHRETGCLSYALHRHEDDPELFVIISKWKSARDYEKHLASSYVLDALARRDELFSYFGLSRMIPIRGGQPSKDHL